MRGIIIGTVAACALLIALAVFFTINSSKQGPRVLPMDAAYTTRVSDGFWKRGAENPKVTLLEYLDFQCPSCGAAFPIIEEAYAKTKDFAQFQVRQYPITSIHDKASVTARAAEAAGRQGKFWDMYTLLYTNQEGWSKTTPAQMSTTLEQYAESLNLNMDQFRADMKDSTTDDEVSRDMAAANRIPIQGTPTFLIDGKVVNIGSADDLIKQLSDKAGVAVPAAQ